jgi:hypothetical protein
MFLQVLRRGISFAASYHAACLNLWRHQLGRVDFIFLDLGNFARCGSHPASICVAIALHRSSIGMALVCVVGVVVVWLNQNAGQKSRTA